MENTHVITTNPPTPTPNTIKKYIPVKNHLPTPMPSASPTYASPTYASPTCTGMFL